MKINSSIYFIVLFSLLSCTSQVDKSDVEFEFQPSPIEEGIEDYVEVTLTSKLGSLTENRKKMLKLFIEASQIMDSLYAYQTYGDLYQLIASQPDEKIRKFIEINQGPWDRMKDNLPFIAGVEEKRWGANFYPKDMTKQEFKDSRLSDKNNPYSFIRRDSLGNLVSIPYHIQFKKQLSKAANLLRTASNYSSDKEFAKFLKQRAISLETDDYFQSDIEWLKLKNNHIDIVIGPIETYEDRLFNVKTAYSSIVFLKDMSWNDRIKKYQSIIPSILTFHPFNDQYKVEQIINKMNINIYDAVFFSGASNVGNKTITLNLPNNDELKKKIGLRSVQFKNVMKAKFDQILIPIIDQLLVKDQRKYVQFEAFFTNTIFREFARALDLEKLGNLDTKKSLREHYELINEVKNDALGLYLMEKLHDKNNLTGSMEEYYTVFISSIFRNVRTGANNDFGLANLIKFNFFLKNGGIKRLANGMYEINYEKMPEVSKKYTLEVLIILSTGNYERAEKLISEYGKFGSNLQLDLFKITDQRIPTDVYFIQGKDVLEF